MDVTTTPLPAETPAADPDATIARVGLAMRDLTTRGAKAAKYQQDSVRVPLDHLHTVCTALYALLRRELDGPDGLPLAGRVST